MSANPIMQSLQRSSGKLAALATSVLLLTGCHANAHQGGSPPQARMMIGFVPLLLVVAVFLLVLLVKRPWKTLGSLLLAFLVFAFLGVLIPRFHMRRQAAWNMPASVITGTHHEAFEGPNGQIIVQSWSNAVPQPTSPVSAAVTKAMAVAGTEEHEVVSSEEPASETPPAPEHVGGGEHPEGPAHEAHEAPAAAPEPPAPADTAPLAEPAAASTPPVPTAQPEIPAGAKVVEKAPDWIHEPAHFDPTNYTYTHVVKSGTATTPFELNRKLNQEITDVTRLYLSEAIDPAAAGLQVPIEYLRQKVVKQQHTESVRRQFNGPAGFDDPGAVTYVQETWARLEYGPDVKRDLSLMWDQHVAERRLWQVGGVGALVMGVLASALGYLRLDTATKGFYTRTLRWGAVGVILALVAAAFTLVG
ncbi:MAG: hypothetical protein U0836_04640 [Pirellulales bacterium]